MENTIGDTSGHILQAQISTFVIEKKLHVE